MDTILITTAVITAIGLLVGVGLVFTGRKFHVDVDERETAVREVLPGNNCGACGYAGCDAMAAAIAKGEAPVNGCPVGGNPVAQKIAAVMGTEAGEVEQKKAFVRCKGNCNVAKSQGNYIGVRDCGSAVMNGLRTKECDYGCLGFGTCAAVCPEHAISIVDGIAVVDRRKCVGCGLCAKACPKGLIELVPEKQTVMVQCMNKDNGITVKKVCTAGCIGCMLCTRKCESGAITVTQNLAHIDYATCTECGACVAACPAKVITGKPMVKAETPKPAAPKPEVKPEAPKPEEKTEAPKAEPVKAEPDKVEPVTTEPEKVEPEKPEAEAPAEPAKEEKANA